MRSIKCLAAAWTNPISNTDLWASEGHDSQKDENEYGSKTTDFDHPQGRAISSMKIEDLKISRRCKLQ